MGHSVELHLAVDTAAYDAQIRAFVPGYESMIFEVAEALARHLADAASAHILDLGAGTGALTQAVAQRLPRASFTLVDADAAMLEQARSRLGRHADRMTYACSSFDEPLPRCDAAMASLALHHVHDPARKAAVYSRIHEALAPGGVLVNADAMVSDDPTVRARTMARWADHLMAHGDDEGRAYARFAQWAEEDRYFSLSEELAFMKAAGFERREVVWRAGPIAVVMGLV